jgi:small nuclear ribonucleoprotein (snRNP)-like protein
MAPSKQSKGRQSKSLAPLLRFFEGMELAVELKTGKIYRGTLNSADHFMNLDLDDVAVSNESTRLLHVHIRGPTIRYVHFPDDADLSAYVRSGVDRERAARKKYTRVLRK